MGLIWPQAHRLGDDTDANLSKSGASLSRRVGWRLRVNSRGVGRSGLAAGSPGGSGGSGE